MRNRNDGKKANKNLFNLALWWIFLGHMLFVAALGFSLTSEMKDAPKGVILAPMVGALLLFGGAAYTLWNFEKYPYRSYILLFTLLIFDLIFGIGEVLFFAFTLNLFALFAALLLFTCAAAIIIAFLGIRKSFKKAN